MNIEDALIELGYKLNNHGHYYTTNGEYRGGSNPTALTIYPDKNLVIDWVTGKKFSLFQLVQVTLKLSSLDQAREWLDEKEVVVNIEKPEPTLNEPKTFPTEWVENLKPDHSYWMNRGISEEVLKEFKGGICDRPRMKNRYVFGIFNKKNQLIGLQGRSLIGKMPVYKILGEKRLFHYPLHLNLKDIKQKKEIILLESVGDLLSCFTAGIRHCLVLFGVSLSNEQLSTLIGLDLKKIIIATNRDHGPGIIAAEKLQRRLMKFFDKRQIEIKLPNLKDLNIELMNGGIDSIKDWYNNA